MFLLDEIIVRTALIEARRHVIRGLPSDEAVRLACLGAWWPYRHEVGRRLRDEQAAAWSTHHADDEAA